MNRVLIFLVVVDLFYLGTGGMLIGLALKTKRDMDRGSTRSNVAENLLLMRTPWIGMCNVTSSENTVPLGSVRIGLNVPD